VSPRTDIAVAMSRTQLAVNRRRGLTATPFSIVAASFHGVGKVCVVNTYADLPPRRAAADIGLKAAMVSDEHSGLDDCLEFHLETGETPGKMSLIRESDSLASPARLL
jgi:hypothetical protein